MNELCYSSRGTSVLTHTTFLIVPMLNIPGRQLVESSLDTTSCGSLRKNENGVDINRNFDSSWASSSDNPASENFRGIAPLSEVQTKLLVSLWTAFSPDAFIDMQLGDDVALTYPWFNEFGGCGESGTLQSVVNNVSQALQSEHPCVEQGTGADR